jgi:hypothetical protein
MAVELVTHEYVADDGDWEDHHTLYAIRLQGDYYLDKKDGDKLTTWEDRGWHIQSTDLVVYREELDAYIELFKKLKAEDDASA